MTITAQDIITRLWEVANTPSNKTNWMIGGQRSAFKLLPEIRGGFGFVASRPAKELGRRGICSANLSTILRELAGIEVRRRQALRALSSIESEMQELLRRSLARQATSPHTDISRVDEHTQTS